MNDKQKPSIRFKGFTEAWEQRKLGEVGTTFTGLSGKIASDFGHGEASFITYMNVFSNPVSDPTMVEHVEIDSKQREVEVGDVFFTTSSETPEEVGMSSVLKEKCGVTYLNSFCFGFRPTVKFDLDYLAYMLRSESVRSQITLLAQGISRFNISKTKMMDTYIQVPSIDEQIAIGKYFLQLDNLITLHQRKYDKLVNVKKSMLEKMFPRDGKNVPEIRFSGFAEAWEQRKLDTITDVRDGTHDSPQYVELGHPFITSKNVKDGFINYEDIQYVSDEDYEEINKRSKVDKNDILMGMIGTIGNIALVRETPDFAIKNVALIKDIGDVYYRYLYHCLQSNSIAHQLDENLDGGTQKFIALNKIRELVIPVPSDHEQHKIGDYMESLDNLITLHQREVEKLQNIKKSCLEKMFA